MAIPLETKVNRELYFPGLRRWDGRARITNKWNTLNNDHELFFSNGDCLVYLQEPGKSNGGPSFRVHSSQLAIKGLQCLVERTTRASSNVTTSRKHRNVPRGALELYLPAPTGLRKEELIDYHLATRNLFAWLYNVPLTGRTLGHAMVSLLHRIDRFRPGQEADNEEELLSYFKYWGYLDFRECVDHALAALHFAESFQMESLWIDAFAHCVGLNHSLQESLEFRGLSRTSRAMISKSRLEMDVRLDRVSRSVINFFEIDLSGAFLGLHEAAREHFDRFRSFLHSYYIEVHGFWPPAGFDSSPLLQQKFYRSMYLDFRNLYQYLVDPTSTNSMENNKSASGGLCIFQNLQAFDERHRYEPLPHPLPHLPPTEDSPPRSFKQRRNTLNPIRRRRAEREMRQAISVQSLLDSSNRDWAVVSNPIVRRFEEFESETVFDEYEKVTLIDGRKVRWILIYAVLQTLVSVIYAPKEVEHPEGLSYSICCQPPKVMPWNLKDRKLKTSTKAENQRGKPELTPDINYLHTNSSTSSISKEGSQRRKRMSLLLSPSKSVGSNKSTASETSSLRRLLTGKSGSGRNVVVSKPSFCEIFVQGYGNGLNEVTIGDAAKSEVTLTQADFDEPSTPKSPTTLVSRESSKSSSYSRSTSEMDDMGELTEMDHLSVCDEDCCGGDGELIDLKGKKVGREGYFTTETWDGLLGN